MRISVAHNLLRTRVYARHVINHDAAVDIRAGIKSGKTLPSAILLKYKTRNG